MKRTLIITAIAIVCIFGLYTYLTWGSNGNPRFMHHRYNKVVTQPLAKVGIADAQYKMGLFWFYGRGESEPTEQEIENAIYWWEKASAKGNDKANEELAKARELQNRSSVQKFDSITENDIVMQITEALIGDEDASEVHKEVGAFLVVYTRNGKPHFASVWPKVEDTQAYGEITPLAGEEQSADGEIISVFSWEYHDIVENKRGSKVVVMKLKNTESTTIFDVRMETLDGRLVIYKGYVKE